MKPKARLLLTLSLLAATLPQALAQQPGLPTGPAGFQERLDSYRNQNAEVNFRYYPRSAADPAAPTATTEPVVEPAFDIKFPGGPAHILLDHLDIAMGKEKPNIMISPEMMEHEIPSFELRQVTVADLFQALNTLSNNQARWELSGSQNPIWILKPAPADPFGSGFRNPGAGFMAGNSQLATRIRADEAHTAREEVERHARALAQAARQTIDPITGRIVTAEAPKTTRVFPLGNYLENYRIEDITTAIQTAWEMMPEKAPGDLKYHKDTRLLIAVGTPEQLMLIQEILGSLQGQPLEWGHPVPPPHGMLPPPARPAEPAAPPKPAKKPTAPKEPEPIPDSSLNSQPGSGSILS